MSERLAIKSENGSALTIVHANNSKDHVFTVTADCVNISGFTVNGATDESAGICLTNTEDCTIAFNKNEIICL
jgi:hypothetical protein